MNILLASFTIESNEHVKGLSELDKFSIKFGEGVLEGMNVRDIFEKENINLIPGILADGHSGKVLSKESFSYIHDVIIRKVKENISILDGIFLFLHGASKVEGLEGGSGERKILEDIRKIVGPYMPIAVVMDPHGNLTEAYVKNITICRCFRESPHTDIIETYRFVANKFVNILKQKKYLYPIYRKLPFVLGGERSVSTDEPMVSIKKKLDEIESDPKILSASFHVGYLRHDNFSTGSGLTIVPSDLAYKDYAEKKIELLEKYCISKYPEFKYHGNALDVENTIKEAIFRDEKHIVITDSGDNVTSGSLGSNTYLLKRFLNINNYNGKKILFAGITDSVSFYKIASKNIDDEFILNLGIDIDEFTKPLTLKVKKINEGLLKESYGDESNHGKTVTISVSGKPIEIIILDKSTSFTDNYQFKSADVDIKKYNIVVVKQGYIFPDLKEYCDYNVMALTDGATNQVTENLVFKQIKRPMLPFDNIDN